MINVRLRKLYVTYVEGNGKRFPFLHNIAAQPGSRSGNENLGCEVNEIKRIEAPCMESLRAFPRATLQNKISNKQEVWKGGCGSTSQDTSRKLEICK
jgi:hypothetical protein